MWRLTECKHLVVTTLHGYEHFIDKKTWNCYHQTMERGCYMEGRLCSGLSDALFCILGDILFDS